MWGLIWAVYHPISISIPFIWQWQMNQAYFRLHNDLFQLTIGRLDKSIVGCSHLAFKDTQSTRNTFLTQQIISTRSSSVSWSSMTRVLYLQVFTCWQEYQSWVLGALGHRFHRLLHVQKSKGAISTSTSCTKDISRPWGHITSSSSSMPKRKQSSLNSSEAVKWQAD